MPVIKIWCLPKSKERKLNQIFEDIVSAVEDVTELDLKGRDSMTILFPPDMMKFGLGTVIIIEVTGLFRKPERTKAVRNRLAEKLGNALKRHFPKATVECFVNPFNPSQGFWTSIKTGQ